MARQLCKLSGVSPWRGLWRLVLAGLISCLAAVPVIQLGAQDEPSAQLIHFINSVRLNEGAAPLGISTLLTQAAQQHAEDLAQRGTATHAGSDGSDYPQRIREARYQAWNDGLLVNEAVWMGLGTAEDAMEWLLNNPEGSLLTDRQYREVGVGYAEDDGIRYFVINVGARPGVLPIFINEGAGVTDSPVVAVHLTNEEAVPMGEGAWIGKAIEVRLSNSPDFGEQPWQPWQSELPWLLEDVVPGDYAVYVEFRDGAGRTAVGEDTIRLVAPGEAPPPPTPYVREPASDTTPSLPAETPSAPETPLPADPSDTTTPDVELGTPTPHPDETFPPFATWTPLADEIPLAAESTSRDWPLVLALLLQGAALLLGGAAFLRRR